MNKRWINTKVEFIWDGTQYVEQSVDGYWYDGEMALCDGAGTIQSGTGVQWGDVYTTNNATAGIRMIRSGTPNGDWSIANAASTLTFKVDNNINSSDAHNGTTVFSMTDSTTNPLAYFKGNVGIGTDNPGRELVVKGSGAAEMYMGNTGTDVGRIGTNTAHDVGLVTDATYRLYVQNSTGNVGIGETAPDTKLHISDTGVDKDLIKLEGAISADDDWLGIVWRKTDSRRYARIKGGSSTYAPDYGLLTFETSDSSDTLTEKMRIEGNTGNVGIGTSSPQSPLSISSTVGSSATVGAVNGLTVQNCSGTTNHNSSLGFHYSGDVTVCPVSLGYQITSNADYTKGDLWFATRDATTASTPTERMRILANGDVGIGDTSPSYKLEVAGTFYASGSSQAFKKNVTDLAVDSSAIYNLNPVSYNYKKDYENFGYDLAEGKQFGLISEEVAESVPELAIMKDGEPKNVDYQKLSVLLLAEMQKMNKRIKDLECHI